MKMVSVFHTQQEKESSNSEALQMHPICYSTANQSMSHGQASLQGAEYKASPLDEESGQITMLGNMHLGTGITCGHFTIYHTFLVEY